MYSDIYRRVLDAYKLSFVAGGGINNLFLTAWELARTCLRSAVEAKCLLVNVYVMGGLQNDEWITGIVDMVIRSVLEILQRI
ncbi:hypothetical protein N7495_005794 [Penicillium taxi]|uniref:uncharacterized protein n=1 Tax=Penicillium taxi TaxID=168475 RepID=UPI0025455BA4|nr:uncharacterized protein N7495_005794 [Penicillium taxi]KAJ5894103.1 hypothetical protein N7495_005794 [Penicillium taxi]